MAILNALGALQNLLVVLLEMLLKSPWPAGDPATENTTRLECSQESRIFENGFMVLLE